MIVKKLIEKIEGEAELEFSFKSGKIDDVDIKFDLYRGIEEILKGKAPRDALVITPRVCGICNHAHLIASVRALESGFRDAGFTFELSKKAKDIREFTLSCELVQNHIKWLYLTIFPQLNRVLKSDPDDNYALKASYIANTVTKAIAIFAGQWPHSSYAVPGGVTCDPTYIDIISAQNLIDEAIRFTQKVLIGMDLDEYLSIESLSQLKTLGGDFGKLLFTLEDNQLAKIGKSYDRFIVLGESAFFKSAKSIATTTSTIDQRFVKELEQTGTKAKAALYKNRFYEVGPMARAIINKEPIIMSLRKRYRDSLITRIYARVHEVAILLNYTKGLLQNLDITQESCTLESKATPSDFSGVGTVEAARGSLIHRVKVKESIISKYEIITPTQWNLSNSVEEKRGVAANAMIGLESDELASFVFKSFDVCSVCTTH
jgi:Ni,Fe-hydrogenase I large subunit